MFCNNCKKRVPDDSEFCQYCGNKIANGEEITESADNPEEAVKIMEEIQKATIINALSANKENQPNFEDDIDFGLVPEKPVYTLATKLVDGETEYLNKLRTLTGKKISWKRRGSTHVDGVNGMIDIYDIFLPLGGFYKTIYINMYGAKESEKAPIGFVFENNISANQRNDAKISMQSTDFKKQSDKLRNDRISDLILEMEVDKYRSRVPFLSEKLKATIKKSNFITEKINNSNAFLEIKEKVKTYSKQIKIVGLVSLILVIVIAGGYAVSSHSSSTSKNYDSAYIYDRQATHDYVLNTSTKKIHRPSCTSAKRISPENYDETNNYSYAISRGYSPCGNCHPYG